MRLADWLNDWYNLHRIDIKPRTAESYRYLLDRYILPALGNVPMSDLTGDAVRHLLAAICATGKSRTAEMVYVLLRAALADSDVNAMAKVKRPRHHQRSPLAWSDESMRAYLAACQTHKHGLALSLGLILGLRRGEICGLRWSDIDWAAHEAHICNQRIRLADGRIVDAPPKSPTSDRVLPIPDQLFAALSKSRQLSGYVCGLLPASLDKVHRCLVASLGLPPIPLHGLRHSMATAVIRHGGDMRSLQALLGHASMATTANRYTHPDRGMLSSALACAANVCYTKCVTGCVTSSLPAAK